LKDLIKLPDRRLQYTKCQYIAIILGLWKKISIRDEGENPIR